MKHLKRVTPLSLPSFSPQQTNKLIPLRVINWILLKNRWHGQDYEDYEITGKKNVLSLS